MFVLGMSLLSFLIQYWVMVCMMDRHVDSNFYMPDAYGLHAEHVTVTTSDKETISCVDMPVENPRAVIICIHGLYGSAESFYGHAKMFHKQQIATIVFDVRANGQSSGDQICLGYKEYLDTNAVVDYAKKKYHDIPIIVFGVSMGAATAINSIGQNTDIDALISCSSYASWESNFRYEMKRRLPWVIYAISYPWMDFITFCKYGRACFTKPIKSIKHLNGRPALLAHSLDDTQVAYENFRDLTFSASSNIETFVRTGNHHLICKSFTHPERDKEYANKLLDFINRVLTTSPPQA